MNSQIKPLKINCPSSSGVIVTSYVLYMPGHNPEFAQIYNDHIFNWPLTLPKCHNAFFFFFLLKFTVKWAVFLRNFILFNFHFIFEIWFLLSFMVLVYAPVHKARKCMHNFNHACKHVNSAAVIESLHLVNNSNGFNRIEALA